MRTVERTVVDVLRNVIGPDLRAGRVDELTVDEIAALAHAVQTHLRNWRASEAPRLRVDLGGWVGGHFAAPQTREILATMLLYADQVVLHDPLPTGSARTVPVCGHSRWSVTEMGLS